MPKNAVGEKFLIFLYVLAITLSAIHLYRKPVYSMDSLQYMGNALLMEDHDIVSVHRRVYAEVDRWVPANARRDLLGHEPGGREDQNRSLQLRAKNALIYAEFLPLFAIRPLYNQAIWVLSKTGLGLVRASIIISLVPYFAIALLLFTWLRHYAGVLFGTGMALLLMISPPLTDLGRALSSDAIATSIAFASLYLIFEKHRLTPGLTLLLASIFFRTDFVALAGPVLLVCWLQRRIDFWKMAVLALLAVGSVLAINHFGGDYGIKMLYYRNFIRVPAAPAEVVVQFTWRDYLLAFRSGLVLVANSHFLPFLLLGTVGLVERKVRALFGVSLAYVCLHFIILPNWQERWVAVFYLASGVCAAAVLQGRRAALFLDRSHDLASQSG
ncbi:MAG TPA: hypothetical protein VMD99_05365 [Terriglobales bacterium]|nr:hypothetical protein [Terriglobales bacterium]